MADNLNTSIFNTAGTAGSIINSYYGAQTQESLLKTQAAQEEMAASQRMSKRVDAMNEVMGAQTASAAARGISLASPTVMAISKKSFDKFSEDKATEEINQRFRDAQLRTNLAMVRNREYASIFSSLSSFSQTEGANSNSFMKKMGMSFL